MCHLLLVVSLKQYCKIDTFLEGMVQVEFCASQYLVYIWSDIYVYRGESSWNPNSNTLEPGQSWHDSAAVCVMA